MLKLMAKIMKKNRIFAYFQSNFFKDIYYLQLEKNSIFTVEKPGRQHLNKMIKLMSPVKSPIHILYL